MSSDIEHSHAQGNTGGAKSCSYIVAVGATADYRTIGHLFGISKPAMCIIVKDVCSAIVKVLLPRYFKVPTGDSLKEVLHSFEHKWGFPQFLF